MKDAAASWFAQLERLHAELHDPQVHTVDGNTRRPVMPPAVLLGLFPDHLPGTPLELVMPRYHGTLINTVDRAIDAGEAQAVVRFRDGGEPRLLTVVDLTDELGIYVQLFSRAVTSDLDEHRAPEITRDLEVATFHVDRTGMLLGVDDQVEALFDLDADNLRNRNALELLHPDDHRPAVRAWARIFDNPALPVIFRVRFLRGDGCWRWGEAVAMANVVGDEIDSIVVLIADVDDDMSAIEHVKASEAKFRLLAESVPTGVFHLDADGRLVFSNEPCRELTGMADSAMSWSEIVVPDDLPVLEEALHEAVTEGSEIDVEVRIAPLDRPGETLYVRIHGSTLRDADEKVTGFVGSVEDVSHHHRITAELQQHARRDPLTGLANRVGLVEGLEVAMASTAETGRTVAVLMVDLDGFKLVNDTMGHEVGDEVICIVAERIAHAVRPADLVARFGGDEFVVVSPDLRGGDDALAVANRILDNLSAPLDLRGTNLAISASIGVGLLRTDREPCADDLLREADMAMFEAKRLGRNRICLFDASLSDHYDRRLALESSIRGAIERNELHLVYQPVVDLRSGIVVAAEALLRWDVPGIGVVGPGEFIPMAQRCGLLNQLTSWTLEVVAAELAHSRTVRPDLVDLPITVNLGTLQLAHEGLVDEIVEVTRRHGLVPTDVIFELVEAGTLDTVEGALELIHGIAAAGFGVAIDDFGMANSSVHQLATLPVNVVKLHPELVGHLDDQRMSTVIGGLSDVGVSLGAEVVAKGLEDPEVAADLVELGVRYGQGFGLGEPMTLVDLPGSIELPHGGPVDIDTRSSSATAPGHD